MSRVAITRLPALLAALSLVVPAVVAQTPADSQPGAKAAAGGMQHNRRGPKKFMLANAEGAVARMWKPDLTSVPLKIEHGSVTLPRTGVDNYHALVVEREWGDSRETLIRYQYMHGKPSGHSTQELTAAEKAAFEIVPSPVPREHQHYRSDESWAFLLRLNGEAADGVPVVLETSHGTLVEGVSDGDGVVHLRIPDDFPDLIEGARDRRSAEFTVSAETVANGITFQTALNAEYRVNQAHWQSFEMGFAVMGIGMLAGIAVGRIGASERGGRRK
jgi:hypothetical protein